MSGPPSGGVFLLPSSFRLVGTLDGCGITRAVAARQGKQSNGRARVAPEKRDFRARLPVF